MGTTETHTSKQTNVCQDTPATEYTCEGRTICTRVYTATKAPVNSFPVTVTMDCAYPTGTQRKTTVVSFQGTGLGIIQVTDKAVPIDCAAYTTAYFDRFLGRHPFCDQCTVGSLRNCNKCRDSYVKISTAAAGQDNQCVYAETCVDSCGGSVENAGFAGAYCLGENLALPSCASALLFTPARQVADVEIAMDTEMAVGNNGIGIGIDADGDYGGGYGGGDYYYGDVLDEHVQAFVAVAVLAFALLALIALAGWRRCRRSSKRRYSQLEVQTANGMTTTTMADEDEDEDEDVVTAI
jgi:hypothetical protein